MGTCKITCYADPGECGYSALSPSGEHCTVYDCACSDIHDDAYKEDGEE